MYSPSRPVRFAALAIASLALTGCAARNVGSYLERGADLARYRTYSWAPAVALETGDPRLDNNPFFHERIQAGIERQLAARGFEMTASAEPDLLIHYHASINQRIDVSDIDRETGNCSEGNDCWPYVYEAGSLVVDFVDARTDKLVWRGWSEDSVDRAIDNQQLLEEKIDKAVTRILQRLPGRL